jgi:hypothetical protein
MYLPTASQPENPSSQIAFAQMKVMTQKLMLAFPDLNIEPSDDDTQRKRFLAMLVKCGQPIAKLRQD